MSEKIDYQKLEKKLTLQKKSCWEVWDDKIKKQAFDFAEGYKNFLNKSKTEREAIETGIELAQKNGFKNITEVKSLSVGDKVYAINRDKSLFLARIGKQGLDNGMRIIMSHIDSPHLDFKVNPLFEDENLAFAKTHYYGGIKKYQWPAISLALHGVVCLENGKKINIKIGEKDDEPIFMITDLLPHLDRPVGHSGKSEYHEIKGEELNLLLGSLPVNDSKIKEKVKLAILEYLYNKYGIKEEDFASAEIQAVPCEKARDLGFDRSLISAYGHDDKVCAYSSLMSFFDAEIIDQTQVCILIDREEIGSDGNTSAQSVFLESFMLDVLKLNQKNCDINEIYHSYGISQAISADTTVAVDPDYKDVHDLRNACRMGFGLAIEKYTGHGGKYSTSEASAEFLQKLRMIFKKDKNIVCQFSGGIGKVDQGGGGTIAKYLANRNIDVVDAGVALFNIHAPLEIASKADIYCAYLGYKAFYQE
ncbi:MAG: aminopeptidase [bacterium]|nr:aminopeptidase [bacterium]